MFVRKKDFKIMEERILYLEQTVRSVKEKSVIKYLTKYAVYEIISGYIDTEEFIDQVVERIKRKQVK